MFTANIKQATLVVALAFGLAACGGTTTDDPNITTFGNTSDNSGNDSDATADSSQFPTDTIPPTSPTNLRNASAPLSNQVSLIWNASTDNYGVAQYLIYRDNLMVGSSTTTSYTDNTAQPSTTYNYHVTAVDAANNQASSNTLTTNTPAAVDNVPPTAPGNVRVTTSTYSSVSLAWNASSDNVQVSGYRVFRNSTLIATINTTSYTDSGLNADTTYQYVIQAYDSSNNATNSGALNTTTPSVPVSASVALSWQNPSRNTDESCVGQLDGYVLHYGTSSGGYSDTVNLQLSQGNVSCVQTGFDTTCNAAIMTCSYNTELLPANTWYFAIQTYDVSGRLSTLSNEASRTIN